MNINHFKKLFSERHFRDFSTIFKNLHIIIIKKNTVTIIIFSLATSLVNKILILTLSKKHIVSRTHVPILPDIELIFSSYFLEFFSRITRFISNEILLTFELSYGQCSEFIKNCRTSSEEGKLNLYSADNHIDFSFK